MQRELDLLGKQLAAAVEFRRCHFNPKTPLADCVMEEKVTADVLFCPVGTKWFLRAESLPALAAIKAVAIDAGALYLEAAPLDEERIGECLRELPFPASYHAEERKFRWARTTLISVGKEEVPEVEGRALAPRHLWTVPLARLGPGHVAAAIAAADSIFTHYAYRDTGDEEAAGGGPGQRQGLFALPTLALEQRPILSLALRQVPLLSLSQVLAAERQLNRLEAGELEEFVARFSLQHGEAATRRILLFTLAGRVRHTSRTPLSWGEARAIARRIIARPIHPT